MQVITSQRKRISGAITVLMSLLLLALAVGSAVYTAKTKLFDIRIANSDLRKNQAIISAEAGLERAIAELDAKPGAVGTIADSVNGNSYSVVLTQMLDGSGDPISSPYWESDKIIQVVSTGSSDDNSGTRVLEQKLWLHSVARGTPNSAITVSGGIGIGGSFNVGANPNGGGLGVPLSVWSDAPVSLSGTGATCGLEEFDDGQCSSFPYSDKTSTGSDVFEDSVEPAGTFPADLLDYTFGYPTSNYGSLKSQADQILADCSSLDATDTGLIWVTGDCTINAGTVVGSTDAPVILVIEDADLKMNGGAVIYGIVFSFETAPGNGGEVAMVGGATIRGAFIADHAINISSGTFDTRYDLGVLKAIEDPSGPEFGKVEMIPGSWKDF